MAKNAGLRTYVEKQSPERDGDGPTLHSLPRQLRPGVDQKGGGAGSPMPRSRGDRSTWGRTSASSATSGPPQVPSHLTFLSRSIRTLLLPPVSRFRFFSSARRSITRSSLSLRVPASEAPGPTAAVPEPESPDPARDSAIPSFLSLAPTPNAGSGCSGSEHKMAPPKRKTHSLPPARLSGRACVLSYERGRASTNRAFPTTTRRRHSCSTQAPRPFAAGGRGLQCACAHPPGL